MIESFRQRILPAVALQTADVYSFIVPTTGIKELNVHLSNVGTGTPVGVWKFQVSDDPAADADFWYEQRTGSRLGTSGTAAWVTLDDPTTIHGDSLTLGGGVAQASDVPVVLGLGGYFRVWYDFTSGGTASSLGTVDVAAKG
jgi:hypothetical protein